MEKCLHVLPMNKLSGAEKMALLICKNLKNYEPVVVCGGKNLKKVFENEGIEAVALNFKTLQMIGTLATIKDIIKKGNIKIVHAHDNTASACCYMIKQLYRLKFKIVSHIHNCYPFLESEGINKRIDMYLRPKYDFNIACGSTVYNYYSENALYFDKSTLVMSNAIDVEEIDKYKSNKREEIIAQYNIPKGKTILGFIGRLDEQKGILPFLDEAKNYSKQLDDCRILMVGDGSQEDIIKEKVKKLDLQDLFIFTGFQDNTYDYYSIIDVFFLPSKYEGLPMVILEAMAFRKAVVSMNVGSISEVINDNTGCLIESGDYEGFLKSLTEVKDNKKLIVNYGEKAYEHIRDNYHISKYVEVLEKEYGKLLMSDRRII
ncbi:MAG: glycosyltransferase [Clostridium sp.]|nr:glycosyltransferase [Clostridium sp.]MDU7084658.1 glycosyltransferase [Clostridium sp.]